MRFRIWPVLIVGFSTLVILIAFSGVTALRRAQSSYALTTHLYTQEVGAEQVFARLRSDVLQSAIAVRDLMLWPGETEQRMEDLKFRERSSQLAMETLKQLIPDEEKPRLAALKVAVDDYWRLLKTPRKALSGEMLQTQVMPQRLAVQLLANQIEALTRDTIERQRLAIDQRQAELQRWVFTMIAGTILVSLLVGAISLLRISHLEKMAERQHRTVVAAEEDLRRLSQQLVNAQEEERRSLSRELHDQIGQVLTALRIGIGNAEDAIAGVPGCNTAKAHTQLDQTKRLAEQALRSVRDIAMGLRPAMLDDLGLGAALEWQVRQFSRICDVPVNMTMEADPEAFNDAQRTCIYRVVQEALNNVSRHAQATAVSLIVKNEPAGVRIEVLDNGVGFDTAARTGGLGLVGMKERVRQLGGQLSVESKRGEGTTVRVWLPAEEKQRAA